MVYQFIVDIGSNMVYRFTVNIPLSDRNIHGKYRNIHGKSYHGYIFPYQIDIHDKSYRIGISGRILTVVAIYSYDLY